MGKEPEYTVIIDTREQTPWDFGESVNTIRTALPAGDYSIVGLEKEVAIERKNLNDLAQTVIKDKKRFHRELAQLAIYPHRAVAIEANLEDILEHRYSNGATPAAVIGSVMWFMQVYNIPFLFWGDRQQAAWMAKQWLRWAWKINQMRKENERRVLNGEGIQHG